jgi:diaminopimelate epimerase
MRFDFVKSHGLGNDYLVVDGSKLGFELTAARVREICNRNTGVGSDGILVLVHANNADFGLRIFNPDGSEAEKSGNGLRIFSKFLSDHAYTTKRQFRISTPGGLVTVQLLPEHGRVTAVRVEMGRASINADLRTLAVGGQQLDVTAVSVGNPHCVIIVPDLTEVDFHRLGPLIEKHPAFPNRTNVQFAQVLTRNDVRALIWERGAGHTLASGSSSCAVAVAAYAAGLVDGSVSVHMEGGILQIQVQPNLDIIMTGPVEETCVGFFSNDLRDRLMSL